MSVPDSSSPTASLSRWAILALALACGVAVANVYFPQALAPAIATGLHIAPHTAALAVTATQIGYAAGIFLFVPLGDRVPYRPLLTALLVLTAAGSLLAALAPSPGVLLAAAAAIGLTTVVPQILIPMTVGLVAPDRRGAVTGTLLSGLIGGILLARTFSGTLAEWAGWRAPYAVAAVAALLLAPLVRRIAPVRPPASRRSYPALLAGSVRLLGEYAELRRSAFYQAVVFAAFTAAWTALALWITGPRYRLGTAVVGLVALVGAASMFVTPWAGRIADRRGPDRVTSLALGTMFVAVGVLWLGDLGGPAGLVAVTAGMLLLDVATQSGQVANQARIFALPGDIRGRLNTAYMTCAFLGGSAGSWLGVRAFERFGWNGVCALVLAAAVAATGRHLARLPVRARTADEAATVPVGTTVAPRIDAPSAGPAGTPAETATGGEVDAGCPRGITGDTAATVLDRRPADG
ncbi:MFS transporter [Nocardia sp. alder85J]|uniref:MFS transporter n=1 Tax=Nocardia sp. alder85J TaxID=2862949 RepID=UPI001CD80CB6|nr:MFS transporter [Nocardia sp. alder85J]MCX4091696.1 MFS transporter [Nocardia sp. alder85J]